MTVKELMEELLDKYLDITDEYWSIEIQQRNGKLVHSIYRNNKFLVYEEPIKETG